MSFAINPVDLVLNATKQDDLLKFESASLIVPYWPQDHPRPTLDIIVAFRESGRQQIARDVWSITDIGPADAEDYTDRTLRLAKLEFRGHTLNAHVKQLAKLIRRSGPSSPPPRASERKRRSHPPPAPHPEVELDVEQLRVRAMYDAFVEGETVGFYVNLSHRPFSEWSVSKEWQEAKHPHLLLAALFVRLHVAERSSNGD